MSESVSARGAARLLAEGAWLGYHALPAHGIRGDEQSMNKLDAIEIAMNAINASLIKHPPYPPDEPIIPAVDRKRIVEYEEGWIIPWNDERWIDHGDFNHLLVPGSAYFVDRDRGTATVVAGKAAMEFIATLHPLRC